MLSILALGMLIAVGAAYDETDSSDFSSRGGDHHDFGDSDRHFGDRDKHHDWLNPGGIHSYSYWYPTYYKSSWYPTYSYTYYPTYYYSTPVVYPTYYYDPVVYDPWYATNVYGWGGSSYYTSSWSWSRYGGLYF
jgi:hypothetical protein